MGLACAGSADGRCRLSAQAASGPSRGRTGIPIVKATTAPARRTLRCRTLAGGGFEQLNHVRRLPPPPVAEQFGFLGNAPAATLSEILLAALSSCLSTHVHADTASGGITGHRLELDVEADIVANPMWEPSGRERGPVGFKAIRVANALPEVLRALVAHAVQWSPVSKTLHDPVHLDVVLAGPATVPV